MNETPAATDAPVAAPVAETPKVETPSAPKEAPKPRNRVALPLSALTRAEREARAKAQEAEQVLSRVKPLEEVMSRKDMAGLAKLITDNGMSLDDLVNVLADSHVEKTPEQLAEAIVEKKLREREEAEAARKRESEDRRILETEENFRRHLHQRAAKDPEKYELVNRLGAADEAWLLIRKAYTGKANDGDPEPPAGFEPQWIDPEKALEMVEAHLRQTMRGTKSLVATVAEELGVSVEDLQALAKKRAAKNGPDGRAGTPAFTNRSTSGVPAVDTDDPASLSEKARHARATRIALAAAR